jgi:outer membrane murein-binding lipoprotein Lpp
LDPQQPAEWTGRTERSEGYSKTRGDAETPPVVELLARHFDRAQQFVSCVHLDRRVHHKHLLWGTHRSRTSTDRQRAEQVAAHVSRTCMRWNEHPRTRGGTCAQCVLCDGAVVSSTGLGVGSSAEPLNCTSNLQSGASTLSARVWRMRRVRRVRRDGREAAVMQDAPAAERVQDRIIRDGRVEL